MLRSAAKQWARQQLEGWLERRRANRSPLSAAAPEPEESPVSGAAVQLQQEKQPSVASTPATSEPWPASGSSLDHAALERLLARHAPVVLHHFATWCDPCEEEMPLVRQLEEQLPAAARLVLLSWDRFDGQGDPAQTSAAILAFVARFGLRAPAYVYTDTHEQLVGALELGSSRIPQTQLRGRGGEVLEDIARPLRPDDLPHLLALASSP